jgi:hypothetical protein
MVYDGSDEEERKKGEVRQWSDPKVVFYNNIGAITF